MFLRGGMLVAAVASLFLGLLLLGMHVQSRAGATPVQQAVVSVDAAAEQAYTPPAAANLSKPLQEEGAGFPADEAVPVTVISRDPADVARDGGARNVSAEVGLVPLDKKGCPPCDSLFGMLHTTSAHHGHVQDVHMQVSLEDAEVGGCKLGVSLAKGP